MNLKSLVITILVAFVCVWLTDFLIHGVWLSSTYGETKSLWRTEDEMMSRMPFMFAGQLLAAAAFTLVFAACVAEKRCLRCTMLYAACMGLLAVANQVIMYSVAPYPGSLVAKWCVAYFLQMLLLGLIVHKVYRPVAK